MRALPRSVGQDLSLLLRARTRLCALPVSQVLETMRPLPIEPLAAMPKFVMGLSVIRGAPVPVVDTGALLGATDEPSTTRFILLRVGKRRVALAIEEVLGIREIRPTLLGALPPLLRDASVEVVSAIGTLDAELLVVLQAGRILTESGWDVSESHGEAT